MNDAPTPPATVGPTDPPHDAPDAPSRASTPAVRAVGLTKAYRLGEVAIPALHDVSLDVERGTFLAVMGPSGSGKSTLLHLLGLLDVPDAGRVALDGRPTADLDDDAATRMRRDDVGFVFQTFELLPNLSARENVLLPAEVAGRRSEGEARLRDLAQDLGIQERLDHRPEQLSGGQRQRVAIARALVNDPVVVLADEPTGNLDSTTGGEVLDLLRRGVDARGWTVAMVTHDPNAALRADRIVFLRDGRVAGEVAADAADARERIAAFAGV
ncbi:MAG: ABC transporter ATP-binding protein [Trueperaceae bacterium]|nr:ABC transporter ATP-binding protein [Trueperaceae bacterium]